MTKQSRDHERKDDAPEGEIRDAARPSEQHPDVDAERQAEREKDLLLRLASRRALSDLDPADPINAAFFDWAARETRERRRPWERRATSAGAHAFAERILARHAMSRVQVREVAGAPQYATARVSGPAREALAAAATMRHAPALDLAVAAGVGRELWDEPCERWIALPDDVPDGTHVALTVAGDSMHPLLHAGDTVLVRVGPELATNAVVVARRPDDGYVVKLVGRVDQHTVELTSLNPAYRPMTIPRDDTLVLGTVVLRWCQHST